MKACVLLFHFDLFFRGNGAQLENDIPQKTMLHFGGNESEGLDSHSGRVYGVCIM